MRGPSLYILPVLSASYLPGESQGRGEKRREGGREGGQKEERKEGSKEERKEGGRIILLNRYALNHDVD